MAILIAQVAYASRSWRKFIKSDETFRLKAILFKACRYGYLTANFPSLEELLSFDLDI